MINSTNLRVKQLLYRALFVQYQLYETSLFYRKKQKMSDIKLND